ncbi:MAG TPA: C1 family peptidase [Flavobacteriales bacterium]|nr:C1 family peptidase [Flavobacteriales bacterium]
MIRNAWIGSCIVLLTCCVHHASGQEVVHPIDGALLPTRATLKMIPTETWTGLPKGYELPRNVDLRSKLPPPGDQGRQNSCIAWALAYGIGTYHDALQEGSAPVDASGQMDPGRTLSPAYPYNLTKTEFDTTDTRCLGSHFDKVFSVLMEQGCCTWQEMPYDPAPLGCFQAVPTRFQRTAERHRMTAPVRVSPYESDQIRYHLAQGTPVAFAMGIDTAFKYGGMRAAKGIPFDWHPECAQAMPGSHAMLAVGYDDADSTFLIMNSYGTQWGEKGYWHMRYDVFDCHVTEAYITQPPLSGAIRPDVMEDKPVERTKRRRIRTGLAMGDHADVQGLSLALAGHAPELDRALIQVSDTSGAATVEMLELHEDAPLRFYRGDDLVTVTYTRASRTRDPRRTKAHIVARVEEDGTDPCIERAILLADRIRSARASRP